MPGTVPATAVTTEKGYLASWKVKLQETQRSLSGMKKIGKTSNQKDWYVVMTVGRMVRGDPSDG